MNRNKLIKVMVLLSLLSLLSLSIACSQSGAAAEVAQAKTPGSTQTSADVSDKLIELEKRVEQLEQGLDERAREFNIVQSAVYEMIIEDGLVDRDWGSVDLNNYSSSWAPTNDMRRFPSLSNPLYGYDKDKDGTPDTNYVPFEKSKWFYEYYDDGQVYQFPDFGWLKLTKRSATAEETLGKTDPYETELHNIQTAVMAMLADSKNGMLDNSRTGISDLDLVTTDSGALVLSNYITGLSADGTVKSGCKYDFAEDGTVTQRLPIAPIRSTQDDYENELHNIQTAVMAMLADSTTGNVTAGTGIALTDMHKVQSIGSQGTLYLSDYLTGLNGTSIQSGCKYLFVPDGTVTQIRP